MAGEEGLVRGRGEEDGRGVSSLQQARRRFMITDILSSVEQSREEERKPAPLDMRLLFPGLRGGGGEAESGEEGEDGEDEGSERGGSSSGASP